MAKTKIAVTVDSALLKELDALIVRRAFANRSQALEAALADKLERLRRSRLARESARLDPDEEKRFADEGLDDAAEQWPEY